MRVLVTPIELVRREQLCQQVLAAAGHEVVYPPPGVQLVDEQLLIEHLQGVDALLAGIERLNARVLAASQLQIVARFGVGYDAIDVAAASELGVAVTITPGTNQVSVAEHALALILGVMRGLPGRDQTVRDGSWRRPALSRLAGKTLGLLGLGRIGKEVVPRAQAFGVKILAHDPAPDRQFAHERNVTLVPFAELIERSDILSLHLPATSETERIIGREALAAMKPGSILINTARGSLIDEEALADALASGHLWGAGLDAFAIEPPSPNNRLLQLPNVLLTPHTAGLDHQSVREMGRLAAECIVQRLSGQAIPDGCLVNPDVRAQRGRVDV